MGIKFEALFWGQKPVSFLESPVHLESKTKLGLAVAAMVLEKKTKMWLH